MNCYECFARVASEDRELNLRPWAIGLGLGERVTPDRLVFVIFVLASVTYDSIARNPAMGGTGKACLYAPSIGDHSGADVFLAIYLAFVKLSQLFAGGYIPFRRLAATYVHSLVPIAIAYQVAHYYTLLLIQGQAIIALLSDPFGWGSNLFGTVDYKVHAGLIGADAVWYKQVAVIVAGHVIAIYMAHVAALRLMRNPRLAAQSQHRILALLVLYTVFSLWILSQPIVETRNNEATLAESAPPPPAPTQNAPQFDQTLRQPPMPDIP